MLKFLSKQIPYNYCLKKQFLIAIILGAILAFIMIFLKPFDTDRFDSNHKHLILAGFGVILGICYLINGKVEHLWFSSENKTWTIKHEIISFVFLIFVSSVPIHFYNQIFLNDFFGHEYEKFEYIKHGLWFFQQSLIPVMFILLPFYVYLRNKFGDLPTSESLSEIEFFGTNKGEKLRIQRDAVLFVKASENYVEIFYEKNNDVQHQTFRNTIKAIKEQAPYLSRCHRSYLVNPSGIKSVLGNSQNAKIEFYHKDLEIPLSKSYYKTIMSTLSI